jgi:hypothetical protein
MFSKEQKTIHKNSTVSSVPFNPNPLGCIFIITFYSIGVIPDYIFVCYVPPGCLIPGALICLRGSYVIRYGVKKMDAIYGRYY